MGAPLPQRRTPRTPRRTSRIRVDTRTRGRRRDRCLDAEPALSPTGESSSESSTRDEPDHLHDRGRRVPRCGAFMLVMRRLEAGMPRTPWLLAAAAVLPLLVPASAVSHPPGFGPRGSPPEWSVRRASAGRWPRRSAPQRSVGRASAGRSPIRRRRRRSRSAPAPAVRTPPCASCPGTRARSRSAPRTAARCSPTASPSPWCPPPG